MKKNTIIIASFLILFGITVPFSFASAQSPEINQKLDETRGKVEQLVKIKDDSSLSEQDKANAEISIKREVLLNVLDLAQLQIKTVRTKLDDVIFPDTEEWSAIKEKLYNALDAARDYYSTTESDINDNDALTLDDIKTVASDVEQHKIDTFDATVRNVNDVILTFNVGDVLLLAQDRLHKINSDITKIYAKRLTNSSTLKQMFFAASRSMDQARSLDDKAKEILLNVYGQDTSPSSKRFIDNLNKTLMVDYLATASSSTSTEQTPPDKRTLIENHIRSLVVKSLNDIKQTYDTFIDMSKKASSLLQ